MEPFKDEKKKVLKTTPPLKKELRSPIIQVDKKNKLNEPKLESVTSVQPTETIILPLKNQRAKPVIKYTNLQSLSRLKDKINKQTLEQAMYNYSKPNTGSLMHGTPNYVPHSFVEDANKKAIASTSSQVGNGFSIKKGDNGTCTLTEDLSTIGLQGKTTSRFNCGLSKGEKAFNSHMKKVLKKLGK